MPTPTKPAGYPCPNCGDRCAEFKRMDEPYTRWSCACGAEGRVAQEAPAQAAPIVHPHWSARKPA